MPLHRSLLSRRCADTRTRCVEADLLPGRDLCVRATKAMCGSWCFVLLGCHSRCCADKPLCRSPFLRRYAVTPTLVAVITSILLNRSNFPMLHLRWAQLGDLGVKALSKGPMLCQFGHGLSFHAHHGFTFDSFWIALGPTSDQHGPTSWAPLGHRPRVGPNPGSFCGLNATRWTSVGRKLKPTRPTSAA